MVRSNLSCETSKNTINNSEQLFDNLPKLIRPQILANILGLSVLTIYDWKYRAKTRRIPDDLFLKIAGRLYVRTDVLSRWVLSDNASS